MILCQRIVQGLLSKRATERERNSAMHRLISIAPVGIQPGRRTHDELCIQVAQLMMDIGLPAGMPALWFRIKRLYRVPKYIRRQLALSPQVVLLSDPPWMEGRNVPGGSPVWDGPGPNEINEKQPAPCDGPEQELCSLFDEEMSRYLEDMMSDAVEKELEQDRAELARFKKIKDATVVIDDADGESCEVNVKDHIAFLEKTIRQNEKLLGV